MDRLTTMGLFAVTAMLVCYALEARSRWYVLGFAGACALGSMYGFLQGAWPFGLIEAVWSVVAVRRWRRSALRASFTAERTNMDYIIAGIASVLLFGYLIYALLKPERF